MNKEQFWNIDNVRSFKGFDVENGEVTLSESEWVDELNDVWGEVKVCGMSYGSGDILKHQDPTAFRCAKSDYESELDSELKDQLDNEDSDNIEFYEGDEYDLEDEEDEQDDEE